MDFHFRFNFSPNSAVHTCLATATLKAYTHCAGAFAAVVWCSLDFTVDVVSWPLRVINHTQQLKFHFLFISLSLSLSLCVCVCVCVHLSIPLCYCERCTLKQYRWEHVRFDEGAGVGQLTDRQMSVVCICIYSARIWVAFDVQCHPSKFNNVALFSHSPAN